MPPRPVLFYCSLIQETTCTGHTKHAKISSCAGAMWLIHAFRFLHFIVAVCKYSTKRRIGYKDRGTSFRGSGNLPQNKGRLLRKWKASLCLLSLPLCMYPEIFFFPSELTCHPPSPPIYVLDSDLECITPTLKSVDCIKNPRTTFVPRGEIGSLVYVRNISLV